MNAYSVRYFLLMLILPYKIDGHQHSQIGEIAKGGGLWALTVDRTNLQWISSSKAKRCCISNAHFI